MRIHEGDIDEAVVRAWGYDEDLLLIEQDEDLILGVAEFYPVLAELATDRSCPKADYAVSIVDFSLMFRVLRKAEGAREDILSALLLFENSTSHLRDAFESSNRLRLELLDRPRHLSEARAIEIGRAALNGVSRDCAISCRDIGQEWEILLSVPPMHRHREWLRISHSTGDYIHSWRGDCDGPP